MTRVSQRSVPFVCPIGGTQPAASRPPSVPPLGTSRLSLSLVLVVVVVVVVVSLSSTLGLRAAGVASLRPFGVVRWLTTTHGTGRGKDIMELALRGGH